MSDIDYSFGDYEDAPESGDNRSEYRLAASASVTLELESPIPDDEGISPGGLWYHAPAMSLPVVSG